MNSIFFVFNPPRASSCGFLLLVGWCARFCSFLYGGEFCLRKQGELGGGLQRGFEGGLKGGLKGGFKGGFKGGLKGGLFKKTGGVGGGASKGLCRGA